MRALADPVTAKSLGYTLLCLWGWAQNKFNRVSAHHEVTLELKYLRLRVDVAKTELLSYWEIWHEHCYDMANVHQPECVVDCGAHIGAFALYQVMMRKAKTVYAYEPSPDVFERMLINLSLNGVANVKARQAAVADKPGTLGFSDGLMSINGRVNPAGPIIVPAVTLDDELRFVNRVDILKIDTEGYEVSILRGASETLKKTSNVVVELHYRPDIVGAGKTPAGERNEIDSILLPAGFKIVATVGDLVFYTRLSQKTL